MEVELIIWIKGATDPVSSVGIDFLNKLMVQMNYRSENVFLVSQMKYISWKFYLKN